MAIGLETILVIAAIAIIVVVSILLIRREQLKKKFANPKVETKNIQKSTFDLAEYSAKHGAKMPMTIIITMLAFFVIYTFWIAQLLVTTLNVGLLVNMVLIIAVAMGTGLATFGTKYQQQKSYGGTVTLQTSIMDLGYRRFRPYIRKMIQPQEDMGATNSFIKKVFKTAEAKTSQVYIKKLMKSMKTDMKNIHSAHLVSTDGKEVFLIVFRGASFEKVFMPETDTLEETFGAVQTKIGEGFFIYAGVFKTSVPTCMRSVIDTQTFELPVLIAVLTPLMMKEAINTGGYLNPDIAQSLVMQAAYSQAQQADLRGMVIQLEGRVLDLLRTSKRKDKTGRADAARDMAEALQRLGFGKSEASLMPGIAKSFKQKIKDNVVWIMAVSVIAMIAVFGWFM